MCRREKLKQTEGAFNSTQNEFDQTFTISVDWASVQLVPSTKGIKL